MVYIIKDKEYEETTWNDDKGSADFHLRNLHTSESIYLKEIKKNE